VLESAPGPAFYFGQFRGRDRYRNRVVCASLEGGEGQEFFIGPTSINTSELKLANKGPGFALDIVWGRALWPCELEPHLLKGV
jgi:hypothetical protein